MNRLNTSRLAVLLLVIVLVVAACTPMADIQPNATATAENNVPLTAPISTAAQPTTTPEPTTAPPTETAPAPEPTVEQVSAPSEGMTFVLVPENSEARYRVREQLANQNLPNDAVGRTNAITGSITLLPDGSINSTNSQFSVDLSTLQTDNNMRDNYVRRNTLQTDQYPTAVFVPTGISGLPEQLPTEGDFAFQVTGDLTIRDVTKTVTWDVQGRLASGEAIGKATTSFTFAEFNMTQPRVPVVLSVVDNITLEADLHFVLQ